MRSHPTEVVACDDRTSNHSERSEAGMTITRRDLLKLSGGALAVGAGAQVLDLSRPAPAAAQTPKRGGTFRLRSHVAPVHFDPHQTIAFATAIPLTLAYSRLVKVKGGSAVVPGTQPLEGDLAESWERQGDTVYVFKLRKGVRWHSKPPVNGRELTAEDIRYTYDRFLTEKGNPLRFNLDPVDRIEVVDRYTVRFRLKEPFVWLPDVLAAPAGNYIVAREVVEKYGDLKKPETAIGTGPFLLERYEPNVKTVFRRHPEYFRPGQPYVDGVEWLVLDDESTGLAMYRTGQLDMGPQANWTVRQPDLEALKQSHPQLLYRDFLLPNSQRIFMRTDQPPFNDVRVRRVISQAIDRQAIIEAVWGRGELTAAVPRGLTEWSLPVD